MPGVTRPLPPRARRPAVPPRQDPRFRKVEERIQGNNRKLKKHPPARQKAKEAQSAAVAPPKERLAGAQANSVDAMQSAPTGKPEPSGFLALLRAEIEKVMPQNLDEADNFMEGGQKEQMRSAVSGNVEAQSEQAAAGIQGATETAPDPSQVPAQPTTPIPGEPAPAAVPVPAAEGMPTPKPDGDISFKATKDEADSRLKEAEVTPEQCKKANDPRFSQVLTAKAASDQQSEQAPKLYRAAERKPLATAANLATSETRSGLGRMRTSHGRAKDGVRNRQEEAKKRNESRRKAVADHIEGIYLQTKTKVEAKLATLETVVLQQFDAGASAAIEQMKSDSERDIEKFKDERYSGIRGKGRWIADLFRPVPPEIKQILQRNRAVFTQRMDSLVVRISGTVDRILGEAKAEIGKGQARIKAYVAGLPADLQAVGREAEGRVNEQFTALTEQVNGAANALAQKLAQRYKEAGEKADAELKKIEEANQGAFFGFVKALGEIVKLLLEFKDKLMSVLRKGLATIKLILADPIGFLGNLIAAIKGGIAAFVANIWTHLKAGFIKWLAGPLAGAGVAIPKDFSLPSIFKLVMDLLGLTYEKLRAKAVKLIGERNVKILERLFEYVKTLITEGPAALWEKVKEDLSNLKAMVVDAIQDWIVTTIVKQAVIKLVSMCNPAGAIIQALTAIYNTVMFFIEKAQQIWAFVEAIINSVHAIATGAIGGAIAWIEQSLARLIPVLIGFLARLIGLGGITEKVVGIIKKVQAAVDRAIDKVLAKIVATVKKLFGKAVAGAKAVGAKLVEWWKVRKSLRTRDGEAHSLYFAGQGRSAKLTVASAPMEVKAFVASKAAEIKADKTGKKKAAAAALKPFIDAVEKAEAYPEDQHEKAQKEISDAMNAMGPFLIELLSSTDWGSDENPLPLDYTKRRAGSYPVLYFGPKSASRIPQSLLQGGSKTEIDKILTKPERDAWKSQGKIITRYAPYQKQALPAGGPTIGLDAAYQVEVGKKVKYKAGKTAGGGLINSLLHPYGYRARSEGKDGDHIVEMQIGGPNAIGNLWPLDKGENRSSGAALAGRKVTTPEGKSLGIDEANKKRKNNLTLMIVKTL
ncbi:MAG: hypothetical protein J0M24_21060 [Verrucomicrobia bacterium]|nr:hypothetical protein [Verrucomicrobiota bacterium]